VEDALHRRRQKVEGVMDLPKMFQGLTPKEAKALNARIEAAVEREYKFFQKGIEPMNEQKIIADLERRIAELRTQVEQAGFAASLEAGARERQAIEKWERNKFGDEYYERYHPQTQTFTVSYDAAAAERKINQLTEEHERLATNPAAHIGRMEQIQTELDTLLANGQRYNSAVRLGQLQAAQPEQDNLNADVTDLSQAIDKLTANPAANWQELQDLHEELDKRLERQNEIAKGITRENLKWSE
jgi:hypothetical protein